MADYYIDSVDGNDANYPGSSSSAPIQTISSLDTLLNDGISNGIVHFKMSTIAKPQLYRGTFHLYTNTNVTFIGTDYGSGTLPELNSATIILSGAWNGPDGNGIYYITGIQSTDLYYEDGYALRDAGSYAAVIAGTIYIDSAAGRTYYKPSAGKDIATVLFEKDGSGTTLYPNDTDGMTFNGLYFSRGGIGCVGPDSAGGTIPNHSPDGWTVENCQFKHRGPRFDQNSDTATWNNLTIQNNIMDYCFSQSIRCSGQPGSFNNLQILGNDIRHHNTLEKDGLEWQPGTEGSGDNDPISVMTMHNSNIDGNKMYGFCTRNAGITYYIASDFGSISSTNNSISRNFVHDMEGTNTDGLMAGIRLLGGTNMAHDITIAYNIISKCVGYGIWFGNNQDATLRSRIENNTIYDVDNGLWFVSGTNWDIKNNLIHTVSGVFIEYYAPDASNTIDYNCYYNATGNQFYDGAHGGAIPWDTWNDYQDTHGMATDPLFINAGGSFALDTDFKLQSSSPCINAGDPVGLTTDYGGNPIIDNPDMGAWEQTTYRKVYIGGLYCNITVV